MSTIEQEKERSRTETVSIDAAVINVSVTNFLDKSDGSGEDKIDRIKEMMERMGPIVEKYSGSFLQVTPEGVAASFRDCVDAVECALFICQKSVETKGIFFGDLSIGISFGSLRKGEVSYGSFNMPVVISPALTRTQRLSASARKYGAHIIIDDAAANKISGFISKYNYRKLGRVLIGETDEFIYDIYDGDETDTKYSKRRSKLFFETGVDLFLQKSYLQARSYFIELLKFDRNDSACKQYVYICDACLAGEGDNEKKKFLDF